jgi:hypothetical protein
MSMSSNEILGAFRWWHHPQGFRRLFSLVYPYRWHEGENEAMSDGLLSEFDNSGLGFYAVKRSRDLDIALASTVALPVYKVESVVAGGVVLWGRVAEGELGYRATHARIDFLVALDPQQVLALKPVAEYYEVPLYLDLKLGNYIKKLHAISIRDSERFWRDWVSKARGTAFKVGDISTLWGQGGKAIAYR